MGLIETEETNRFTFEPFAAHPFYTEVNRDLVRQALAHVASKASGTPLTIVDMACGTGAVTRGPGRPPAPGRRLHPRPPLRPLRAPASVAVPPPHGP